MAKKIKDLVVEVIKIQKQKSESNREAARLEREIEEAKNILKELKK